jgi:hypothetical protein
MKLSAKEKRLACGYERQQFYQSWFAKHVEISMQPAISLGLS